MVRMLAADEPTDKDALTYGQRVTLTMGSTGNAFELRVQFRAIVGDVLRVGLSSLVQ